MKDILIFVGVSLLSWMLIGLPIELFGSYPGGLTLLAVGLMIVPGVLTLGLIAATRQSPPVIRLGILMSGTFIRLIFAFLVGGLIYMSVPGLKGYELPFVFLGSVFYLITLAIETGIVYRQESQRRANGLNE